MKAIIVILPNKDYTIIPESKFLQNNEFRTQNQIIEILDLLNIKDYVCDIIYI